MPKSNFTLVLKKQIIPKVHFLVFQTDSDINYTPGQFASLEIEPKVHRAYSICYVGKTAPQFEGLENDLPTLVTGDYVCFMISTKPGGAASEFFETVETGTTLPAIGPSGRFTLKETEKPRTFVATGTGLAPFVSMISLILEAEANAKVDLFFGSWTASENFSHQFFAKYLDKAVYPNFTIYSVAEDKQGVEKENLFEGRVTTVIPEIYQQEITSKQFYLCGHPAMVTAMAEVLTASGVNGDDLVMEKYGK